MSKTPITTYSPELHANTPSRDRKFYLSVAIAAGVALYVVLDAIAQLLPPHYSVLHQPESDLGVGPYSAIMNINFVVRGLTALALAALLTFQPLRHRQRVGAVLIAAWGVCSASLSVVHTDISTGPLLSSVTTIHGGAHLALAFAGFSAASIGILLLGTGVFAARHTGLITYTPVVTFIAFIVTAFSTDLFGLFERLFIAAVLVWTVAVSFDRLAMHLPTRGQPGRAPGADPSR